MDKKIKIVGICLVKNEDSYIEQVILNIVNFCDKIIVLDNMSEDKTFKILKKIASKKEKVKLYQIKNISDSHKFIEKYANTKTWIFGVDGDEIYDPIGLKRLRKEILSGTYQEKWQIRGNFLHCIDIDLETKIAKGYLAPPSREATKLYNFYILKSWKADGESERFFPKTIKFKDGFEKKKIIFTQKKFKNKIIHIIEKRYFKNKYIKKILSYIYSKPNKSRHSYYIYNKYNFDESYLRCLHLRFVSRSSIDKINRIKYPRPTPLGTLNNKKFEIRPKYCRGEIVSKKIGLFFNRKIT
jgi:hypothetical protein